MGSIVSWGWSSRKQAGRQHLCGSYSDVIPASGLRAQLIVTCLLGDLLPGWSLLPKPPVLILNLDSLTVDAVKKNL